MFALRESETSYHEDYAFYKQDLIICFIMDRRGGFGLERIVYSRQLASSSWLSSIEHNLQEVFFSIFCPYNYVLQLN